MKQRYAYYAFFESDKEDPGWVNVTFPDIYPGVTCGTDMDDAIYMAKDLLRLMVSHAPDQCAEPTPLEKLQQEFPGKDFRFIEIDIDYSDKPLNELADEAYDYCKIKDQVMADDFCAVSNIHIYTAREVFQELVKRGVLDKDGVVLRK